MTGDRDLEEFCKETNGIHYADVDQDNGGGEKGRGINI